MKNSKLLFFSNVPIKPDIKGTGNWIFALAKAINQYKPGNEIYIFFFDPNVSEIQYEKISDLTYLVKAPHPVNKSKIGYIIDNWTRKNIYDDQLPIFLEAISKINPDLIQIFGLESPFIRIIGFTSIPIVTHIQGLLAPILFKYNPRFSLKEIYTNSYFVGMLRGVIPSFRKLDIKSHIELEKSIYKKCRYFLGRTEWDRLFVQSVAPHAKYFYCQEILRDLFYQNQWRENSNKNFKIFTTTSESFYKNTDIIFETTKIIEEYHPEFNFEWRVAGLNENGLTAKIMRKRGFNSKNLNLMGNLNSEELINELLASDLFVLPSAIENSPNALQEAMLLGMPILATYAGGVSSIIEHRKSGILVPEGEPYSLAGAILDVRNNYSAGKLMGQNAREISMQRNDPKNVVDSLFGSYEEILNS
jgi:glycosyltransferase involved in cell wall biosynthesis